MFWNKKYVKKQPQLYYQINWCKKNIMVDLYIFLRNLEKVTHLSLF
jgi:hypothetical protein